MELLSRLGMEGARLADAEQILKAKKEGAQSFNSAPLPFWWLNLVEQVGKPSG
jgi:hypothetical protein